MSGAEMEVDHPVMLCYFFFLASGVQRAWPAAECEPAEASPFAARASRNAVSLRGSDQRAEQQQAATWGKGKGKKKTKKKQLEQGSNTQRANIYNSDKIMG